MSIGTAIVLSGWIYASSCRLGDTTEVGIVRGRIVGYALTFVGVAIEYAFNFAGL